MPVTLRLSLQLWRWSAYLPYLKIYLAVNLLYCKAYHAGNLLYCRPTMLAAYSTVGLPCWMPPPPPAADWLPGPVSMTSRGGGGPLPLPLVAEGTLSPHTLYIPNLYISHTLSLHTLPGLGYMSVQTGGRGGGVWEREGKHDVVLRPERERGNTERGVHTSLHMEEKKGDTRTVTRT